MDDFLGKIVLWVLLGIVFITVIAIVVIVTWSVLRGWAKPAKPKAYRPWSRRAQRAQQQAKSLWPRRRVNYQGIVDQNYINPLDGNSQTSRRRYPSRPFWS